MDAVKPAPKKREKRAVVHALQIPEEGGVGLIVNAL
jgi:hypothetical protein